MALHPHGEFISDQIRERGLHYEIENLLRVSRLSDTSYFFDIGANIGNHSNFFAQKGSIGTAIEPQSRNFELLKLNAGEFVLLNVALGETTKETQIRFFPSSMGNSHIEGSYASQMNDFQQGLETVMQYKLDDLNVNPDLPTLTKIDVEGFELRVLIGGQKFFSSTSSDLWLELHTNEALENSHFSYRREDVLRYLNSFGYLAWNRLDRTNYLFTKRLKLGWKSLKKFPAEQ